MIVRALTNFIDFEQDVKRSDGETWEVTEKRFLTLNASKFGQLVEEVKKTPENGEKRAQIRKKRKE